MDRKTKKYSLIKTKNKSREINTCSL